MSQHQKVKDLGLAAEGRKKIRWAESRMPVLMKLRERYSTAKPLAGLRISGCLHVTKETAVLLETLQSCGAQVSWCGCNPLSTQDDIAAALAANEISIYAWYGLTRDEFYECIDRTLEIHPNLTLDDGADLIHSVHTRHQTLLREIIGGTEETTTGVHRLRAMAADGALRYPVFAVNDSETKWDFDNVYGTGQSSLDGILRATNILVAGKNFVIAGYGHCGRGVAMRAKGMGANTIVTEIDPIAALRANLEGHRVMTMDQAAPLGDIFITATGMKDVITQRHFEKMKEGALVCNTGHYDCEVNLEDLRRIVKSREEIRPHNMENFFQNGKRIYVLAEGRLVNLVAAEGHPSEVMDMSFANQFLAMLHLAKEGKSLENKVYVLPKEQDREIARVKLETMGISIDHLTPEQEKYARDYSAGT